MKSSSDFSATFRCGARAGASTMVVHLAPPQESTSADPAKVGFVVSKAVGGAVVRNRVRRRLRALMSELVASVPAGAMVVVRALPPAASASFPELRTDLVRLLAQAEERLTRGKGRR